MVIRDEDQDKTDHRVKIIRSYALLHTMGQKDQAPLDMDKYQLKKDRHQQNHFFLQTLHLRRLGHFFSVEFDIHQQDKNDQQQCLSEDVYEKKGRFVRYDRLLPKKVKPKRNPRRQPGIGI